ncbi:hypothetical protein K2173_013222 [Erythroxylum novogranatense]|uniref:Uncharacterized protein n=1 Tax=Erythroxylum novogranatense TaxID=1862640 RepID=A0AAV8SCP7_9ROSI|nr:hypothetical protein K2173_013222 [Erythroxylum novogranatense]
MSRGDGSQVQASRRAETVGTRPAAGVGISGSVKKPIPPGRPRGEAQARVFAMAQKEAVSAPEVVTVLLDSFLLVSTPLGRNVIVSRIFRDCELIIKGSSLVVDLLPLDLKGLDVIVETDVMEKYQAKLDCGLKQVEFDLGDGQKVTFRGDRKISPPRLVSALLADKMMGRGCEAFLACVVDTSVKESKVEDIPIVREFPDVFPEELPSLPPEREIEFAIDLTPGMTPISIPPYKMVPAELKELKEQLEKLLEKGFIRSSSSP